MLEVLETILSVFVKFFSRFHWASLSAAALLAAFCWWKARKNHPGLSYLRFLFPRSVWLHRSALLDYRFVLFDKLVLGILVGLGSWFLATGIKTTPSLSLSDEMSAIPWGIIAAYTLVLLLAEDFARYWAHRLSHTIPLLWQFHKVHHSPEVLVPFSQMRTYPVGGLINVLRSVIAIGSVTGLFMLIFPGKLTVATIFGVNAGRFVFDLMGSNLRHSHIWLSFGPKLSHIFISPAQHQIHHSIATEHHDRNFGSQFALWDWAFGTLYVPQKQEKLTFGIHGTSTRRMRTIKGLYLEPFRDAARLIRLSRKRRERALAHAEATVDATADATRPKPQAKESSKTPNQATSG